MKSCETMLQELVKAVKESEDSHANLYFEPMNPARQNEVVKAGAKLRDKLAEAEQVLHSRINTRPDID